MIIMGALKWLLRAVIVALVVGLGTWPLFGPRADQRGIWVTEGYGFVLDIGRFWMTGYQYTDADCAEFLSAPAHRLLLAELADGQLGTIGERLAIGVEGNVNLIMADPIDAVPEACETPLDSTPQGIFDHAYATMNEHYPFFDLHGVDWASRYQTLPADTDEDALWTALSTSLEGLDDGHTYLVQPETGRRFSPAIRPDWREDIPELRTAFRARGLTRIPDTGLEYTVLPGNIGYIFLRHMATNPGLFTTQEDIAFDAFSQISDALADTRGIIIDNRLNPGGTDTVSLAYAAYFTDTPRTAFTKTTRTATGYTAPAAGEVKAIGSLQQPVILLNSNFTVSAAEIFTMAMKDLPQVTVMGDTTSGALSDIHEVALANGWILGLSHQKYLDTEGQLYEGIGIPPEVPFAVTQADMMSADDPMIAAAIARLTE